MKNLDEKIKVQVEDLARALDDNGGHALSNPGLIERETWVRIARHIPIDVIEETRNALRMDAALKAITDCYGDYFEANNEKPIA